MADALRIVSDTGQSLRVIPSDRMRYRARAGHRRHLHRRHSQRRHHPATGVAAAAYTNSVANATSTVLYDLDTPRDLLARQDPPNAGTLATTGSLRFPAGTVGGFDIVTSGGTDTGYAASPSTVPPPSPCWPESTWPPAGPPSPVRPPSPAPSVAWPPRTLGAEHPAGDTYAPPGYRPRDVPFENGVHRRCGRRRRS